MPQQEVQREQGNSYPRFWGREVKQVVAVGCLVRCTFSFRKGEGSSADSIVLKPLDRVWLVYSTLNGRRNVCPNAGGFSGVKVFFGVLLCCIHGALTCAVKKQLCWLIDP